MPRHVANNLQFVFAISILLDFAISGFPDFRFRDFVIPRFQVARVRNSQISNCAISEFPISDCAAFCAVRFELCDPIS